MVGNLQLIAPCGHGRGAGARGAGEQGGLRGVFLIQNPLADRLLPLALHLPNYELRIMNCFCFLR